ncbi:MAG: phenylalanine--tRNA ligase beta subunit-related protein [Bacteroidota bacterium]
MTRPSIQIDAPIQEQLPYTRLGLLSCTLQVTPSGADLLTFIQGEVDQITTTLTREAIAKLPVIKASRKAYKTLGKDPARYRLSAEALLRRVTGGKTLYEINNAVDLLNLVSIQRGFSIGGYDLSKVDGSIHLGVGQEGEPYEGIGRGALNIAHMPVLRDAQGAFGTPTSDSVRTSVRLSTTRFLMVFYDFDGRGDLEGVLEGTQALYAEHLGAGAFDSWLVS